MVDFSRPQLSPEDRALIDAAIAAGRVTVCPPHTYTPDEPIDWQTQRDASARRRGLNVMRANRAAIKDAEAARLIAAGLTAPQIAMKLGVSIKIVQKRIRRHNGRASQ